MSTKIGILETGRLPEELAARYGDYPGMFERLLGSVDPELDFTVYRVTGEQFPASAGECDAWLITGSRHGVYDPLPWIKPLKRFLAQAYEQGVPTVGICFGHQVLAEALGGRAEKSDKGWGLGVHRYPLRRRGGGLEGVDDALALNAFHQDQVTELPADAEVLAGSEFCPYAVLAYRGAAISIQPHPEFSPEFQRDLLAHRRGRSISDEEADRALDSLEAPLHTEQVADWIVRFIQNRVPAQRRAS